MFRSLLFVLLISCTFQLSAQLTVAPTDTPATREDAVNSLVGEGIEIDNISVNCGTGTFGIYQFNGTLLGFEEGIILATGDITNALGPNDDGGAGSNSDGGPITFGPLDNIADVALNDYCVIEFTLTPAGDEISFDYVWASEEYNEFVCTMFNDIFAFFISGPNPAGGMYNNENIAILDTTGEPVSIGTINNGDATGGCDDGSGCPCNSIFYVDNTVVPLAPEMQYDGFTKVLTAKAATIPCEPYTLTLAIADGSDEFWDSAIFLGANSLESPAIALETDSDHVIGDNLVGLEGCVDGRIIVTYEFDTTVDVNLFFEMEGLGDPNVATPADDYLVTINGTDITGATGSILFEPGDTEQTLVFEVLEDGIPEGTEMIIFSIVGSDFCSSITNVRDTLFIYEEINAQVFFDSFDACADDLPLNIPLQVIPLLSSGTVSYEWSPAAIVDDPNLSSTIGSPTGPTVFECAVSLNGCTEIVTVTVEFGSDPPYSDEVYTICDDASGGFLLDRFAADPDFLFTWMPATGLDNPNSAQPTYTGNGSATYDVLIGSANPAFCGNTVSVEIQSLSAGSFSAGDDVIRCLVVNEQIGPPSSPDFTYSWDPATGLDDPNIAQPTLTLENTSSSTEFFTYELTVTDASGCSASDNIEVSILTDLEITGPDEVFVFVNEPQVIELAGGGPNAVYTWTPTQFLSSNTGATNTVTVASGIPSITYNIDVLDDLGCTGSFELTVITSTRATAALPTAFSPNGDSANDVLLLETNQVDEILDWRIFNRWGNVVYENSGDINEGWDGNFNGNPQDIGVYTYIVTFRGVGSDVATIRGQVTLLK